ncbi:MAG: DUF2934 domain-containing protein [Verrucomicrobia bacterium]|nr:DUF2934 domain-containing protein [Verrucomicrobiota bacterium]
MKTPTQAEVAQRAYQLWTEQGSPHGRDIGFWLEAEQQLMADVAKAKAEATVTPSASRNGGSAMPPAMSERVIGEMASESAVEYDLSPAPSDQDAIKAALQKKEARAPKVSHSTAPKAHPVESGKPLWDRPHSS